MNVLQRFACISIFLFNFIVLRIFSKTPLYKRGSTGGIKALPLHKVKKCEKTPLRKRGSTGGTKAFPLHKVKKYEKSALRKRKYRRYQGTSLT